MSFFNPYNPCHKSSYDLFNNSFDPMNLWKQPLGDVTNQVSNLSEISTFSQVKNSKTSNFAVEMMKEINSLQKESDVIDYYLNASLGAKLMKIELKSSREKVYAQLAKRCENILSIWSEAMNKKIISPTNSGLFDNVLESVDSYAAINAKIMQKNLELIQIKVIVPNKFFY